jgi:hypothetical protein
MLTTLHGTQSLSFIDKREEGSFEKRASRTRSKGTSGEAGRE